jgi:hypothetical protein
MKPPHNKLITGRAPFVKGTCPEEAKEDKLTKVLASARK